MCCYKKAWKEDGKAKLHKCLQEMDAQFFEYYLLKQNKWITKLEDTEFSKVAAK